MAVGLCRMSQGKVSKSEKHKIMNELLELREPWARVTSLQQGSRHKASKCSLCPAMRGTHTRWVRPLVFGWLGVFPSLCAGIWALCAGVWVCLHKHCTEEGLAGNYKCYHLLASLSPVGPPHPVVSGYITIEASSQLGAKTGLLWD